MIVLSVKSVTKYINVHLNRNWGEICVFYVIADTILKFSCEFIALAKFFKLLRKSISKLRIWKFAFRIFIPLVLCEVNFPRGKIDFLILFLLQMNSRSCSSSWLKIFSIFFSLKASEVRIGVKIFKIGKLCYFNHLALIEAFDKEIFLENLIFLHPKNALLIL